MTLFSSIQAQLADKNASADAINLARRMTRSNEPDLLREFLDDENCCGLFVFSSFSVDIMIISSICNDLTFDRQPDMHQGCVL